MSISQTPFLRKNDPTNYKKTWNPIGQFSRCNPCTWLSSRCVKGIDFLSNLILIPVGFLLFNNNSMLIENPTHHEHRENFHTTLMVGTAAVGVKVLCKKTMQDREGCILKKMQPKVQILGRRTSSSLSE